MLMVLHLSHWVELIGPRLFLGDDDWPFPPLRGATFAPPFKRAVFRSIGWRCLLLLVGGAVVLPSLGEAFFVHSVSQAPKGHHFYRKGSPEGAPSRVWEEAGGLFQAEDFGLLGADRSLVCKQLKAAGHATCAKAWNAASGRNELRDKWPKERALTCTISCSDLSPQCFMHVALSTKTVP